MRNLLTYLSILIYSICFSQSNLKLQLKKIINQTIERGNSKYSEYGIDNKLWSKYPNNLKKNDTISFYTTSNIPFCNLEVFTFFKSKLMKIQKSDNCSEPPTISVSNEFYNFKIINDLVEIYFEKVEFLRMKIIAIEKYKQEKFGKNSYKLNFIIIN